MIEKSVRAIGCCLVALSMMAPAAFAQTGSGIAGSVKDTSGAVLPGVTVEVSSPALIERTRTVVTDGQGQYKVVDLRAGTYTVTFTLPGFNTVRREGIELTASFTATVNADLQVGGLEESLVVSASTPLVDTHNNVQQKAITSQVLADLPTGRLQQGLAAMVVGVTLGPTMQDVGGTRGEAPVGLQIHNSRANEMADLYDGMRYNSMIGPGGGASGLKINMGSVQEISLTLSGGSAEFEMGGIQFNVIPKDGGNTFSGSFFLNGANRSFQSDNIDDDLRARGLKEVGRLKKLWDVNPSFGGPVMKDRLWFYTAYRHWGNSLGVAGTYYNLTPQSFTYTPDFSRQGFDDTINRSATLRLTWQPTPKNKISAFYDNERRCTCHSGISTSPVPGQSVSATVSPEASGYRFYEPNYQAQATWTMPATNRLLFEAGTATTIFAPINTARQPGVTPDTVSVLEASTSTLYRAAQIYRYETLNHVYNFRGSASYITGSHALKIGFTTQSGTRWEDTVVNSDIAIRLLNGQPNQVTQYATPYLATDQLDLNLGVYAQDQWTIRRLTINPGVRFDYLTSSLPEQNLPATRFVPARSYPAMDVLNWKDISPRLGAAYDLFGNGKTAIKGAINRYVAGETTAFAHAINPVEAAVTSVTRTWTVPAGAVPTFNPFIDCDLSNLAANGWCGAVNNVNFGKPLTNRTFDPDVLNGWGKRGYNWDISAGIQHELAAGMSMSIAYARKSYGNFVPKDPALGAQPVNQLAVKNLATTPADYDPYCITAPMDPRLPGGGGYQVCGLYDVKPAKFGQVQNFVTYPENYGDAWSEVFDGVDASLSARFNGGASVYGGVSTGRVHTNTCTVVTSAADLRFCDVNQPLQTQLKMNWVYPLPGEFQFSGTFQNLPGSMIAATYVARNAEIAPSLGRNLSAGPNATVLVQLIDPETMYEPRRTQLDLRLTRNLRFGRTRIQPQFDIYNVLNANSVQVMNTTYGPAWLTPTLVLPGRLVKFGVQMDF